jgi:hypothetical protein
MKQYNLSVLIPARSEEFLKLTVEDILRNKESETEIIVGLDEKWANPPLEQHPDLSVIYVPESIGQRHITKTCAQFSRAKYIAKCDAHVGFDKGFDRKLLEGFKITGDNVTVAPIMRNLWVFSWKCTKCGKKTYQGTIPTACEEKNYKNTGVACDGKKFVKKIIWELKHNPQSTSFCFDSEPHFQYFEDYKHREPYVSDKKTGFTETMSLQGSFFCMTREKYLDLDIDDETLGSWGSQGLTVACKTWLSGGRVLINHNTHYAHLFRTKGGSFGFPYPQSGRAVAETKKKVKDLFFENKWPKQIYPLSWLVEKFWPVPGWDEKSLAEIKKFDHVVKKS